MSSLDLPDIDARLAEFIDQQGFNFLPEVSIIIINYIFRLHSIDAISMMQGSKMLTHLFYCIRLTMRQCGIASISL